MNACYSPVSLHRKNFKFSDDRDKDTELILKYRLGYGYSLRFLNIFNSDLDGQKYEFFRIRIPILIEFASSGQNTLKYAFQLFQEILVRRSAVYIEPTNHNKMLALHTVS